MGMMMVAYSFNPRFVEPIELEIKTHTMREKGQRRHAKPGDDLQLYTGMRTKACRRIGTAKCSRVSYVKLNLRRSTVKIGAYPIISAPEKLDEFAKRDGFSSWQDLREFWRKTHGKPLARGYPRPMPDRWEGILIEWDSFKKAAAS